MLVTCKGQVIMKSIRINGGYRVIGNLMGGATMRKFDKYPDHLKEFVSPMTGTQSQLRSSAKLQG